MTDQTSGAESEGVRREEANAVAAPPPRPRWVKIALFLVLALVVALVVSRLAGVEHGPGRHSAGPSSGQASASVVLGYSYVSAVEVGGRARHVAGVRCRTSPAC